MFDFKGLEKIAPNARLDELGARALADVQRGLAALCYPVRTVDGLFGPRTRNAWAEFVLDCREGDSEHLSEAALDQFKSRTGRVFEIVSKPAPTTALVKESIRLLCEEIGLRLKEQIAYVLATAQWETNHTFKPVKEAYWLNEGWRKQHLRYYPYYGRGYVQLTWDRNYKTYGSILDEKLVEKPDLALDHSLALFVLVHGFKLGTFTGRKLEDFVNERNSDFSGARRCINGEDKHLEIAALARHYLDEV